MDILHTPLDLLIIGSILQVVMLALISLLPNTMTMKLVAQLVSLIGILLSGLGIYRFLTTIYHNHEITTAWFVTYSFIQTVLACVTLTPFLFNIGWSIHRSIRYGISQLGFETLKILINFLLACLFLGTFGYVATQPWSHQPMPAIGVLVGQVFVAVILRGQAVRIFHADFWGWWHIKRKLDRLTKEFYKINGQLEKKDRSSLGEE